MATLTADSAARKAAHLLAAEIQEAFASALPHLKLHDFCHGSLRIPAHGHTSARSASPVVAAPDAACTHGAAQTASDCLPLWRVQLYRGACRRQVRGSGRSPVPSAPPSTGAEVTLTMPGVDLFRSTCREAFPAFPPGWKHGFCAHFSAHLCNTAAPQSLRFELASSGPIQAPSALLLNGSIIAAVENERNVQHTGNFAAWAIEHTNDALVALPRGCHHVEAFLDDPAEGDKLALGNVTMVRHQIQWKLCSAACHHQIEGCKLFGHRHFSAGIVSMSCLTVCCLLLFGPCRRWLELCSTAARHSFAGPFLELAHTSSGIGHPGASRQQAPASLGGQRATKHLSVPSGTL